MRRLLEDELHPGWIGFRLSFAATGALTWSLRAPQLEQLYSEHALIVQAADPPIRWSSAAVWLWWLLLISGFGWVASGRRVWIGALLTLIAFIAFRQGSPYYIFMYDQLALWQVVALLFYPEGGGLRPGSPFGRYLLTLTYIGLYASTGISKLRAAPSWLWGAPLSTWLVDSQFAGGELARWLSAQPAILAVMGFTTILFEVGFPLALLHRRARQGWLLMGGMLHLGIFFIMDVFTFSLIALAAYPLLVSREDAVQIARGRGRPGPRRTSEDAPDPGARNGSGR